MVGLLESRMLATLCTTLLCLEIRTPWMYLFVHLDRRWGHVFISMRGQRLRCMFEYMHGQITCFHRLPMFV